MDRSYDFLTLKHRGNAHPHVVVLYNGHGDVDGIHPDGSWLSYEDVADFFYKANLKNMELLRKYVPADLISDAEIVEEKKA